MDCFVQAEAGDDSITSRTLVSALMQDWAAGSSYPIAHVRSSLGQAGLHRQTYAHMLSKQGQVGHVHSVDALACVASSQVDTWKRNCTPSRHGKACAVCGTILTSCTSFMYICVYQQ